MTAMMWTLVIICFIAAYVGIVMPLIPGVLMMWAGFLIYHFMAPESHLSLFFWLAMIMLTVISLVSDYIAGSYFVKRYGGSRAGEITAALGVLVGSFIIPPFGIIIIPFIAVFIVEMIVLKKLDLAIKASIGSLFGFLTSTFAKIMILTIMVIWFFGDIALG